MMRTYLGDDADALDGFEFLTMAEAGEVGHWSIVEVMAQRARDATHVDAGRVGEADPGASLPGGEGRLARAREGRGSERDRVGPKRFSRVRTRRGLTLQARFRIVDEARRDRSVDWPRWPRLRRPSSPAPSAGTRPAAGSASARAAESSARSSRSRSPTAGGAPVAAARPLLRLVEVEAEEADRIPTGVPELDRVLGGGLVPASLVLVGGEPGVGKSTLLLMALRAIIDSGRRALLVTGEESAAQVKLRADRLGGGGAIEILAETELETVCATLERERPEVCVIDSVQTLYAAELGSAPGSVAQVREAAGAPAAGREGERHRDLPRRPRDEGRRRRRPARARAPRRLRAPVRGRPLPRAPDPACGEEPFRLDERARRLRDDRHRARRRPRSVRALRPQRGGRGRRRGRLRARGDAADPARDPGARLADRPGDAAPGRRRASIRSGSR